MGRSHATLNPHHGPRPRTIPEDTVETTDERVKLSDEGGSIFDVSQHRGARARVSAASGWKDGSAPGGAGG
jgi:hypothetical protein